MGYRDPGKDVKLDLSSAGRGLQQTLLLLAYLYANPGAVVLLDEPDAHLEILRQHQVSTFNTARSADRFLTTGPSAFIMPGTLGREAALVPFQLDVQGRSASYWG